MKKIFPFIIFVILLLGCEKENKTKNINQDDEDIVITLTPYIIENYSEDAKQLYFDEIFKNDMHEDYMNPALDEQEIEKILEIIQAVYNSDSPERDTVFNVYDIHGYYCYGFSSMYLKVDTTKTEIHNLANNIFPTGEPNLDQLLTTYHFDSVATSYSYPRFPWLTIYTDDEYNMIPLEKEFSEISSILIAEFNKGCVGDGNTITIDRTNDPIIITFSIGEDDCPSGCIYHRYWEFEVSNGIAKFKRAYED